MEGPSRKSGKATAGQTNGGIVSYCIHGTAKKLTTGDLTPYKLIQEVQKGLPVTELRDLRLSLAVPEEKLADMLGISKAVFHPRHKGTDHRLKPAVSDRVVRFARLLGQAVKVFGNLEDAKKWLGSPQVGLGSAVPLDYAKSEIGAREVENLLGRIEYGVYS